MKVRGRRWLALLGLAIVAAASLLLGNLWLEHSRQADGGGPEVLLEQRVMHPSQRLPAAGQTLTRLPADAIPIKLGIHIKNIYNLELEKQIFSADGWYWLEWPAAIERFRLDNKIDAGQMVEFLNQVEAWDSLITQENPEPRTLPDGGRFQLYRFSARFYIDQIDERHAPFETVVLPIVFEVGHSVFNQAGQAVRLVSDPELSNLLGDYSELAGFRLRRAWIQEAINAYDIFRGEHRPSFSQLIVRVAYGSEPWAAFMKWILPLLIVMTIVLLAPSLESSLGEMRLAIPSTAVLTLVFLQQTYKGELPSTPYLTYLDELYTYCYLVAVGLFILFLWSSNRMEKTPPAARDAVRLQLNRLDSHCQWGALAGLLSVAVLAWFL